jgi:4-amino-4-deoxy-L-arabinose transferase-like glycosyltransferase
MEHGDLGPEMNEIVAMARPTSMKKGVLLFVLVMAYFFLFVEVLWRIGDEGTLVYGAQLVAQGALPYRDFFEVMGPASFYWLGLFFKLFGTNVIVARAILLFTASFTIILLYWMTRRIYQGPYEVLPSIFYLIISFPLWPGTNHHWDSNLFALLAVGAFFLWQDRGRWWFLALAGVLAGLTSCFIQQKGLFLVAALALVVLINGYRAGEAKSRVAPGLGILLGGYAAVGGLVLLFFYHAGGLSDLIYANLIWPLTRYENVNRVPYGYGLIALYFKSYQQILHTIFSSPLSQVLALLIMAPFYVIFCLPILLIGFAGVSYFSKSSHTRIFDNIMLPYWAAGFAMCISEMHRRDIMHLIYGSPLLVVLFFVCCYYYLDNKKLFESLVVGLITCCLIFFGSFNALIALRANQKIVTRRGILYGFKENPALKFLIEHTKPGDYAFIYPYYPMYYFLADVKNPTRYSILLYHINTEAQFDEAIRALEQKQVKYVLWDTLVAGSNLKIWFPQYKQPPKDILHLEQYLEDHYEAIGTQNGFKILRRRGPAFSKVGGACSASR